MSARPKKSLFLWEPLEQRLLLSADSVGVILGDQIAQTLLDRDTQQATSDADDLQALIDHLDNSAQTQVSVSQASIALPNAIDLDAISSSTNDDQDALLTLLADSPTSKTDTPLEIVFIDSRTPNYEHFLADLYTDSNERNLQIVLLDPDVDGIQQISETLSSHAANESIDAVHIISHGDTGVVQLGSSWLSLENIERYETIISDWNETLSVDADLLIYGCNLAANESGLELIRTLSEFTDADVAASDDLTGHASLGGNWDLEFSTGSIETSVAFSTALQQSWTAALLAPTADASASYAINEGDSLTLDASGSSDPEGDPLIYLWDLNNDSIYGDATGVNPTITWANLQTFGIDDNGVYGIGLQVDDGSGGTSVTTTPLTVSNVAPTLTSTGASTINAGDTYTLNLTASDPGNDIITSWTINWGDYEIETIVGNPASVTHVYTESGFTRGITTSAADEDGTWTSSDLVVGNDAAGSASAHLFDGSTGKFDTLYTALAGELESPYHGVIGPDGNLYAIGYNSDSIVRFDSTGNYLGEFIASGTDGLNGPDSLAFGPDGKLYIVNYGADNILRFNADGSFVDVFGSGGGLTGPTGIAWGPDGDLYVAGWNSNNVVKFDGVLGGVPTTEISSGLTKPEQITFDSAGDLYISNGDSNNVKKWDGTTLTTYFSDPSLDFATGLTFGPDGQLYVSSHNNDQIVRFNGTNSEVFVAANSGGLDRPEYLSFTPAQQVTINDSSERADATSGEPYSIIEGGTLTLDGSNSFDPEGDTLSYAWDLNNDLVYGDVTGVTPTVDWATLQTWGIDDDGSYTFGLQIDDGNGNTDVTTTTLTVTNVAPTLATTGTSTINVGETYTLALAASDPGNDVITQWTIDWGDYSIETFVGNPASVSHVYTESGFTRSITASAIDEDGSWTSSDLLVWNFVAGSEIIHRFDGSTGEFDSKFSSSNGELDRPYKATIGPDGNYYVSGFDSDNIVRYDPSGAYLGEFIAAGTGGLTSATGLTFGPDGKLYVANYYADNILRFNADGSFQDIFGSGGDLDGPTGIIWGPDGDLYISNWFSDNVVKLDGELGGVPTTEISSGLTDPDQLTFDSAGNLYIANGTSNDVKKWDGTTLTTYFSDPSLDFATGLTFGPDGQLYVSSGNNDLIVRFDGFSSEVFVAANSGGLDEPEHLIFTPAQQVTVNYTPERADATNGEPYSILEGGTLTLDGSNSFDPEGDTLSYAWDLNNDLVYGDVTGVTPMVDWATLQTWGIDDDGSYTIGLQIDDGNGNTDVTTTTLAVTNVAPTLNVGGANTAYSGGLYTLNLSATDPGADTISSWTVNWGDGDIEILAGSLNSAMHVYTNSGFTNNITVSATDEDNSNNYIHNDLFVGHYAIDAGIYRISGDGENPTTEFANFGALDFAIQPVIGPDGYLYVSGEVSDNVLRYNADTGIFIDEFITQAAGGITVASGITFGPNGNLYVADYGVDSIREYDATTGAYLGDFVSSGSGGLGQPYSLTFGPSGDLYVGSYDQNTVYRYDGTTGSPVDSGHSPDPVGTFIPTNNNGGLGTAEQIIFGPDGNLYVADRNNDRVLRFDGVTGAFIDAFVPANSNNLITPNGLTFGPDGHLYVSNAVDGVVLRYDGIDGSAIDEYVTGLNIPSHLEFAPDLQVTVSDALVVDTTLDTSDGDTSSITALLADKGVDGFISLREAITAANNTTNGSSPDAIHFDIAGAGPHTINLFSALPTITDAVIVDGTSEPDYSGSPVIELNGNNTATNGLTITAGGSTIRGLVINQFTVNGIDLQTLGNNTIEGNYIGTNIAGDTALSNAAGISITNGSSNNIIGGSTIAQGNLISGNFLGIHINGIGVSGNVIQGNYIGTNSAGNAALGNTTFGVYIDGGSTTNTIGGTNAVERNIISANNQGIIIFEDGTDGTDNHTIQGNYIGLDVTGTIDLGNTLSGITLNGSDNNTIGAGNIISGNDGYGIQLGNNATGNSIQGNYIGTDATGTLDRGNTLAGVTLSETATNNTVGGILNDEGNLIAYNAIGVNIETTGTGNAIRGNSIHSNIGLGIDLRVAFGAFGITDNDAGDIDTGANNFQNFPVLNSAIITGTDITISGSLHSLASTTFAIDFYTSASANISGHGEGEQYIASTSVTTDASGNVTFSETYNSIVPAGGFLSATATDTNGNTSEFSLNATVVANQPPVADAGGPYSFREGDSINLNASASTDPQTDPLTYEWDLSYDGITFNADILGETPTLTWTTLQAEGIDDDGTYTIAVRADDGQGNVDINQTTVTVDNTSPTLTVTGNTTISDGAIYTLNLSAIDPGNETITNWTINWGDGTIDTIAGNPSSATHAYTGVGLSYNITASVTDEDGTYFHNELLISGENSNHILRIDPATGALLQEFATADGLTGHDPMLIGPDGLLYVGGDSSNVLRYSPQTGAFIDTFVTTGSGGLNVVDGLTFGPNGNLFVSSNGTGNILEYDATTGAPVGIFSSGINSVKSLAFGPDGNLYIASASDDNIQRFNGVTGVFIDNFVVSGAGGLDRPTGLLFHSDGNLYVTSLFSNNVLRFDATSGAFIDEFVTANSGGLSAPVGLTFGPDGNLYVGNFSGDNVLRFDGSSGVFIDEYVIAGTGGLNGANFPVFIPSQQVMVTAGNQAPTITSSIIENIDENQTIVQTLTATDPEFDEVTFAITGGNDNGLFSINGSGQLIFTNAPDFESPIDTNTDNVYEIEITANDGNSGTNIQLISVTVNATNDNAPVITSPITANVAENTTAVHQITATDADLPGDSLTFGIVGGNDDRLFSIDGSGNLSFIAAPDYELPIDVSTNNIYEVDVAVFDGTNTTLQSITVTVTSENDNAPVITSPTTVKVTESLTTVHQITINDADLPGDAISINITGTGSDDALFSMDASGNLSFIMPPNLETPADADSDNVYEVDVIAFDGINTTTQSIRISVVAEKTAPPLYYEEPPLGITENNTLTQTDIPSTAEATTDTSETNVVETPEPTQSTQPFIEDEQNSQIEQENTTSLDDAAIFLQEADNNNTNPELIVKSSAKAVSQALNSIPTNVIRTIANISIDNNSLDLLSKHDFLRQLDELRNNDESSLNFNNAVVGSTLAVSTSLSVGYVAWLARSGALLSSVLTSLPAWQFVDPAPVLAFVKKTSGSDEDEDDDSLESMVKQTNKEDSTSG